MVTLYQLPGSQQRLAWSLSLPNLGFLFSLAVSRLCAKINWTTNSVERDYDGSNSANRSYWKLLKALGQRGKVIILFKTTQIIENSKRICASDLFFFPSVLSHETSHDWGIYILTYWFFYLSKVWVLVPLLLCRHRLFSPPFTQPL